MSCGLLARTHPSRHATATRVQLASSTPRALRGLRRGRMPPPRGHLRTHPSLRRQHDHDQPQPPQHRLRLLVHSHAAPGGGGGGGSTQPSSAGSSSSSGSGTGRATMRQQQGPTPRSSPSKAGGRGAAGGDGQQPWEDEAAAAAGLAAGNGGPSSGGSSGSFNPSWLTLVLVAALGIVICYADRSNMSTAILPMAEAYGWDKAFQGVVLSAFFAGYAATQVLGGSLADAYGGKRVLTAGVALWSLFTVITPQAAAAGTAPLLAARVMLGVGEGVAFPAIHSIIARNVPVSKRSTAVGIVTASSYAGTALAFGLAPLLISRFGWQTVFYLFGGSALLWLPLWLPLNVYSRLGGGGSSCSGGGGGSGSGSSAARLKAGKASPVAGAAAADAAGAGADAAALEDEPLLLPPASGSSAAAAAGAGRSGGSSGSTEQSFRSFRALLRRREVWAICLCQYAQSYGMYGLLTWLPTFFADYYGVKVGELGGYTLLPYLLQGLVGAGAGALADSLLGSRGWSVRSVRVGLQLAGMLGPAACLVAAVSPASAGSPTAASALITAGLGLSALSLGAVSVNHLDIAPRHAGMVFGAGNTAATLAGLVSVPLTGWLLERTASWPLVFGLIAGHFVVGSAVWVAWVGDRPLPEDGAPPDQPPAAAAGARV